MFKENQPDTKNNFDSRNQTIAAEKQTDAYFRRMRDALRQWVDLSEPHWHTFASIFRVKTFPPLAYVLTPGAKVYELIFLKQGLLRFYYCGDNGVESNKAFVTEDAFVGPLASSVLDLPVIFGIQALETSVCLTAKFTEFTALFAQDPIFERLGRLLAESLLVRKELRTRSLLLESSKDRYLNFLSQESHLVDRVPQYHIASYLGITEVSLSRLKKSLQKEHCFQRHDALTIDKARTVSR